MYLYLLVILTFLILNYFLSIFSKKYTYEKFFIYVIFYFIIINFINLIYLQDINFFTFGALFSVLILFLFAAVYKSVSIKIMIYLYNKGTKVNVNRYFLKEFIKNSFNNRIEILINNGLLFKKNKRYLLSQRGKKYLKFFLTIQSIYKVKFSG